MPAVSNPLFRGIPSVSELLESPPLRNLVNRVNPNVVVSGVSRFLDRMKDDVRAVAAEVPSPTELAESIASWIETTQSDGPRPAINATGHLLHDELGGALLADVALTALVEAARTQRLPGNNTRHDDVVETLLCEITGAESAAVFHEGPSALLVSLAALAVGREVVVSRGQVVDIDGLPLPELVALARAQLREVGATNVTRIDDFAPYTGSDVGAWLAVSPRDFSFSGRQAQPTTGDLAKLGKIHNVPVIVDLGVCGLVPSRVAALQHLPNAKDSVRAGVDLCLVRGQGLLGGPACSIVLGRREWVEALRDQPLRAAVRANSLTLAALAATLRLYVGPNGGAAAPLETLAETSVENLRNRAERLAPQLAAIPGIAQATPQAGDVFVSSCGWGGMRLAGYGIGLRPKSGDAATLAQTLRATTPSILARVEADQVILDLRSVPPSQDVELVKAVETAFPQSDRTTA
jgi:L-seryl-tRNA(Ser) seleniumtransferase